MLATRIIPVLLLDGQGLVKTRKFKEPKYIGDPINAVRIFNEKEVDELIFLDITAGKKRTSPNFELLSEIASEAFIPFAYGGGVASIADMDCLFKLGVEKVILNTLLTTKPEIVKEAVAKFGSQSIVASIDVYKDWLGRERVYTHGGSKPIKGGLDAHLERMKELGVGEVMINSINRDGMMGGYDTHLIKRVTEKMSIPVIACGGAGSIEHLQLGVIEGGADAVAAGSLFVFSGPHRAVMINYPQRAVLETYF